MKQVDAGMTSGVLDDNICEVGMSNLYFVDPPELKRRRLIGHVEQPQDIRPAIPNSLIIDTGGVSMKQTYCYSMDMF